MVKGFLSHSSKDKHLVNKIAENLRRNNVFFDKWDLDCGDIVPAKLAEGIMSPESKWFILIASKNSMESRWVRWELNIAIVRQIQDENYRIVVVKIDDCVLHPELTPYLYVDRPNNPGKAIEEINKIIHVDGRGVIPAAKSWKRSIVDRFEILAVIDQLTSVEGYKGIILWGLYGIGKTTLAEHIANNVFGKKITRFSITIGHDLLRIVLEMSARAKTEIPKHDADKTNLIDLGIIAFKELIRQDNVVFFDDADLITDQNREFKNDFSDLLKEFTLLENITPIIIASSFQPKIDLDLSTKITPLKVGALEDQYIVSLLERWIIFTNPEAKIPEKEKLENVAKELYGYPLATKFAAFDISKYSIEQTISDLSHFESIRIDIAKQLLGRLSKKLDPLQFSILEILTAANLGLTQRDIAIILKADPNSVRNALDGLFTDQLILVERNRMQIIPLMRDYFWRRIYATHKLKDISMKIAVHCQNQLSEFEYNSEDFIHYCSIACRLFLISNNEPRARELMYYFKGELRDAASRLYYAQDFELSLKYVDAWLQISPTDLKAKWLKARCLTRLEKFSDAEIELKELESSNYPSFVLNHAWGLYYKQKGDLPRALIYYRKGLEDRPDNLSLKRDYGDALERVGDIKGAYTVLKSAYEQSSRDRFIAPKYAAILERKGFIDLAIEIMEKLVVTYPEEAFFYHRLSTLYKAKGDDAKSYINADSAVKLNPKLSEAVLHLASLEIKRDNLPRVNALLSTLPENISFRERRVRDTIFAEMLLREEKTLEARTKLQNYDFTEDTFCAEVLSRVELKDALHFISQQQYPLAKERILKGLQIIQMTLEKFPNHQSLISIQNSLDELYDTIIQYI